MKFQDITPERAVSALARLQVHVPLDVELVNVLLAASDPDDPDAVRFVTVDGAVWWCRHGSTERIVQTSAGLAEATCWSWRIETSRNATEVP